MTTETEKLAVDVEDTGPCSKRLKITVPSTRVDREIEQTMTNVAKSVTFPGFRQGKAPRRMVEARLGERVMSDVKERLVQAVVEEAIGANELKPIGDAELDFEAITVVKGTDLAFEIGIDVRPEFELPELESLEVAKPSGEITDAMVDEEIDNLRSERAKVEDAGDEPLGENGIAHLGVTLKAGETVIVDDEEIDWQHPSTLLGGMPIDGLVDALTGARKGDEIKLTTSLPEDFRDEEQRGADADIIMKVSGIDAVILPAADAAFAESMDYDDLDEMRGDLRKQLERRAEAEADRLLDDAIADALLSAVPLDVPPSLVRSEANRVLRQFEMSLRSRQLPEEAVVQQVLAAKEQAETKVTRDLRVGFLLERIATDRKVFVTENEVLNEIAGMAAQYNRTTAEMQTYVERNGLDTALRASLRERKTLQELRDVVKIVEAAPAAQPSGDDA